MNRPVTSTPSIWVDADACPRVIKEILFRASERTSINLTLVANQLVSVPALKQIRSLQVAGGFDVADQYIIEHASAGDLIITADIPLAAEAIDQGCKVLNPRGEWYTTQNIRQRLNMRDFMDSLRGSGIHTGGPPPLSASDRQAFANHLDRYLRQIQTSG